MDRIEDAYGKCLPVATLFAEATIKHLAECLRTESLEEVQSAIVPVQRRWFPSAFLFPAWRSVGGLYCRKLARLLGPEQPFYGVMPNGCDGKPFLPTVEAMAEENIRKLVALQPQGPYFLGGYCNGGLVAYEMARQMEQQGLEVGLVILVETLVPRHIGWLRALVHCVGDAGPAGCRQAGKRLRAVAEPDGPDAKGLSGRYSSLLIFVYPRGEEDRYGVAGGSSRKAWDRCSYAARPYGLSTIPAIRTYPRVLPATGLPRSDRLAAHPRPGHQLSRGPNRRLGQVGPADRSPRSARGPRHLHDRTHRGCGRAHRKVPPKL